MRRYWTQKLEAGEVSDDTRKDARKLRRILDEIERSGVIPTGEEIDPRMGLPSSTIWVERPRPWVTPISSLGVDPVQSGTRLSQETTLYHDAEQPDIFVKQSTRSRNNPYEVSLDVLDFDGGYASLAIGLPQAQIDDIQRSDLIRLDIAYSSDKPINALARANVKIGPNVEVITREIDRTRAKPMVEFDLFYVELDAQKITDVWIDVIFERPAMNVITVHDLRLSRRPRAKT